jgi:hypothetical protein
MAIGPPAQLAGFVAYTKREISRRRARASGFGWSEAMWSNGYLLTALPTQESQDGCLRMGGFSARSGSFQQH